MAAEADIQAHLNAAAQHSEEAVLAQREFQVACQFGEFRRAEEARLKAVTHFEACLDAFMRAHRIVIALRHGP